MLRGTHLPAVCWDLDWLADSRGSVLIGRENDASICMEVPELPMLMSRKHAELRRSVDGRVYLVDLGSTNGTYTSLHGQPLRRIPPHVPWEVSDGTLIGFGGPESISVGNSSVHNPFIFRFYSSCDARGERAQGRNERHEDDLLQGDQMDMQYASASDMVPAAQQLAAAQAVQSREGQQCPCAPDAHHASQPPCTPHQAHAHGQHGIGSKSNCSILASHLSCHLCHDLLIGCHTLSCGHMFCGHCLATWLPAHNFCATCRRAVAGVPVRCFQVDSIITDLLHHGVLSFRLPASDRLKKETWWECVQAEVTADWTRTLEERKRRAVKTAEKYHQGFMALAPFPDSPSP